MANSSAPQPLPSRNKKKSSDSCSDMSVIDKANARMFALAGVGLAFFCLLINWGEDNHTLYLPLGLAGLAILASLVIARRFNNYLVARFAVCLSMMGVGVYMLLAFDGEIQSRLFWLLLLPPMTIYCLGLRCGSFLLLPYFLFLTGLFMGPFNSYLREDYPLSFRYRFLAAMLGTWIFAFLQEYGRHRTQKALKRAIGRLEHDALTDALTGLGNRRDFQNFFTWVQAKAIREQKSFCLALLDIDHFKSVNDKYGHEVGDAVLQHLGRLLLARIRAGSRLFRWGGEEFVILMPETTCEEALIASERLRHGVENNPYMHGNVAIACTVSVGLHCGNQEQDMNEQMTFADSLLYQAKRCGRNQVQSCTE